MKKSKILLKIILGIYIMGLVGVLLLKGGRIGILHGGSFIERLSRVNFIPFKTIISYFTSGLSFAESNAFSNLLGNIIIFIPLGFMIPLIFNKFRSLKSAILIGFLSSFLIEILQFVFKIGSCDIDDIILNTFGSIVGFILFRFIKK